MNRIIAQRSGAVARYRTKVRPKNDAADATLRSGTLHDRARANANGRALGAAAGGSGERRFDQRA